jgi:hypothetical protein
MNHFLLNNAANMGEIDDYQKSHRVKMPLLRSNSFAGSSRKHFLGKTKLFRYSVDI